MVDLGDLGPCDLGTGKEIKVGTIEASVQTDLDRLGKLDTGVRGSMAQVALKLARALDNQPDDAGPTTTARLAQELRTTLLALMGVNTKDGTGLRELFDLLSRPVRDAADAGTQESR